MHFAGGTNITIQGPGSEKAADSFYESTTPIIEQGQAAGQRIEMLDALEQALQDPNVYTGTAGGLVQNIKTAAKTVLGVDVGGETSGEVIDNLAGQLGLNLRSEIRDVQLTETEYQRFLELAPNLGNSASANRVILDIFRRRLERQLSALDFAASWELENSGSLSGLAFQRDLQTYLRSLGPVATKQDYEALVRAAESGPQNTIIPPREGNAPQGIENYGSNR